MYHSVGIRLSPPQSRLRPRQRLLDVTYFRWGSVGSWGYRAPRPGLRPKPHAAFRSRGATDGISQSGDQEVDSQGRYSKRDTCAVFTLLGCQHQKTKISQTDRFGIYTLNLFHSGLKKPEFDVRARGALTVEIRPLALTNL